MMIAYFFTWHLSLPGSLISTPGLDKIWEASNDFGNANVEDLVAGYVYNLGHYTSNLSALISYVGWLVCEYLETVWQIEHHRQYPRKHQSHQ